MLCKANGMPKIQIITDEVSTKKYGGSRMYFAPPVNYDKITRCYTDINVTARF